MARIRAGSGSVGQWPGVGGAKLTSAECHRDTAEIDPAVARDGQSPARHTPLTDPIAAWLHILDQVVRASGRLLRRINRHSTIGPSPGADAVNVIGRDLAVWAGRQFRLRPGLEFSRGLRAKGEMAMPAFWIGAQRCPTRSAVGETICAVRAADLRDTADACKGTSARPGNVAPRSPGVPQLVVTREPGFGC
ncbi:hypothetical protein GCM10022419_135910 [Nonomuraea rosea]|uniref:Uncharacterized protein n=1 Tax=Nonomuraea rosea TaxID=638574 RepID=A0ABP7A978_9ACTN